MRLPTIKDVARISGVSVSTVSRVLNKSGYASEDVQARVMETVKLLDYKPNMVARGLKSNTSRTIGLVVTDITNPFFASIAKETEEVLYEKDYNLIICNTSESPEKELRHLKQLYERHVDGILLCSTGKNNEFVRQLAEAGVAIILIDRDYDDLPLDVIKDDNVEGADLLTETVIRKGHRNIALLKGHPDSYASNEREKGYLAALQRNGIKPNSKLIFHAGASGEDVDSIMERILAQQPRPTAIISLNALITKRILAILNTKGLSVPGDMALASYGLEEFKTLYSPSITCIVQQPGRYGKVSAKAIMELLEKGKTGKKRPKQVILFNPELFEGGSV